MKKGTTTVLSVLAAGGTIVTAILAARETPKAMKLLERKDNLTTVEKVKTVAPVYIPAIVSGVLTVACIFSASVWSRKQQAAVTSAYALLNHTYKRYTDKLKELYGEEAHKTVLESIAVEKGDTVPICAECMGEACDVGFGDIREKKILFYEPYSQRYFESTISQVLQAEYHLNRNFAIGGDVTLNDFYLFLGIDKIEGGDEIGWSTMGGYCWIDFSNYPSKLDDGTDYYIIDMMFCPEDYSDMYD